MFHFQLFVVALTLSYNSRNGSRCLNWALNKQSKASGPGDAHRASPPRPDAALSLGMAFVEAAGAKTKKTEGDQKSTAMKYSDPAASETAAAVGNASAGKGEDATLSKLGVSSNALSEIDQLRCAFVNISCTRSAYKCVETLACKSRC